MTGIAALALSAGFTSCSHDIEPMTQEEINQIEAQKIVQTYEQAFIKTFGQPAANQNWGFGAANARTRSADVNHNQWYSTADGVPAKYGTLEEDPVVTNEERIGVFRYMNRVDNRVKTTNEIWKDYFVSQVWDGGTNYILNNVIYGLPTQNTDDPRQYTNNLGDADNKISNNGVNLPNGAEYTPLSISYANQNGATTKVAGGDKMDELRVDEVGNGTFTHINNFNGANNVDPWYAGKTWMTNNSGTYDFAYNQTESSFISHKYLIIPGTEIFANDATLLAKYGQYYYVCFDYENRYTDEEKAKEDTYIEFTPIDNNGYEQAAQKVTFNGYYTNDNLPSDQEILTKFGNQNYTKIKAGSVSVAGYKNGDKHFAGDNVYTDWIVRISPAKYKNTPSNADLRIMAEDLSASDDTDFDFNDVVFDVYYGAAETAKIEVLAAGGTLPLRIKIGAGSTDADFEEVHGMFRENTNIMINTNASYANSKNGLASVSRTLHYAVNSAAEANNITIQVKKTVDGKEQWIEMKAAVGKPAAKFACLPSVVKRWANERESLLTNSTFSQWVQGAISQWQWKDDIK